MNYPTAPFKLGLAAVALCADHALAQQADSLVLEELIVTAQMRSERLLDVPISIAVKSADELQKTGVRQLRELAEFVPNLTISSGNDSNTAVRIRGVGAMTRNIGFDTRVGVYQDGVYLGQSPAQNLEVLDLERIEVARGPQGTLYGKNTVAGAINLITVKPADEKLLTVRGEYGNLASHRVSVIGNLPLTENLAMRLSATDNHRDGYVDNITTGTEFNERDGSSLRWQLGYHNERVSAVLAADYLESERVSFFGEALTDWSGTVYPDPVTPGRLQLSNNVDNYEEREILGLNGTVSVDLGQGYSLTSITALRDTDSRRRQDSDHSRIDLLAVDYPDSYEQFTQEWRLFSPEEQPFSYVAGLYYYDQKGTTSRLPRIGADLGVLLGAQGSPLTPFGAAFQGASVGTFGDVDTESWAVYINGSLSLSERLTLGFGARYTREEKNVDYSIIGDVVDLGFTAVPAAAIFGVAIGPVVEGKTTAVFRDSNSYSDFSPVLSLIYAVNEHMNLYVRYSSAFKSGGFNVDFVSQQLFDNGLDFDTETVDAYEIGLKGTALESRVQFSLIAYQMDFDDYQLNQFIDLGNNLSAITIQNAASVRARGVEAELTWYPHQSLMLAAAVGTNDAEFESFPGGGSARHPAGIGADLAGNKLPEAPELSAAFAVQHNQVLQNFPAEIVTRLDWTYTDDYFTSEDNISVSSPGGSIPFGRVDSFALINGRVGLESPAGWSIYLWGRNLLDEDYVLTNTSDFFGTLVEFPGEPRTYGVELGYRFF